MLFSSITFLFVFLPIDFSGSLFSCSISVQEPGYADCKSFLLCMGRTGLCHFDDIIHLPELCMWSGHCRKIRKSKKKRNSLIFAVVVNLLILGFFKYYGFLMESVNAVLPFEIAYRELPLPLGISFYTFQALSYIIDVYRGEVKPQKKLLYFALYIFACSHS